MMVLYLRSSSLLCSRCIPNGSKWFKTPTSHLCSYGNQYIHTICIAYTWYPRLCAKKNRFSEHFTRWNKYPSVHVQLIPLSFLGCAKKIGDGFRVQSLSHCNRLLVIWSICVRYQSHCRQQITLSCHSIVVTT